MTGNTTLGIFSTAQGLRRFILKRGKMPMGQETILIQDIFQQVYCFYWKTRKHCYPVFGS